MTRFLRPLTIIFSAIFAISLAMGAFAPGASAQTDDEIPFANEQAISLLENLTPEERVGQLFLITFEGTETGPEAQITELINNYHIGGVVLLAEKDNFIYDGESSQGSIEHILEMNRQLQLNEWNGTRQTRINPGTGEDFLPSYIPLFIGLSQEGDGYPNDQIQVGLTSLPNAMALGATWDPELAAQVGNILGQELSKIGVNLLLGPSLDVLETPQIEGAKDFGTRSFGGDPYWVGKMGRAYIQGVHTGSQNQVAVVAKHFPGHGSSDRLPEEEVATVRKSLDELERFDLAPFFDVTGAAPSIEETTDALLTSHIRYQGLQGNIRATTRPVSFDPQAFSLLMQFPKLDSWRQNGGVMISDNLGSPAVRQFYDLTSQPFEARRVALNAFLAGNDLLYVADFSSANEIDPHTAALRTLEFFAQKYREDSAFAQRVDESVLRILSLKFRLYPYFSLGRTVPDATASDQLNQGGEVIFNVARQATTLISPSRAELDETIPDPPNQNDRMVFLSDSRDTQQCTDCPPYPLMETTALKDAVIRLYGPQAGGQVLNYNLSSYSMDELEAMLDETQPDSLLENNLKRANWIVFSMLQADEEIDSFQMLSRFLSERPDLFQQKRLIVFAFTAPYYLDATNISKLSAYYGLYSKTPEFIDVAGYLLFRELHPSGAAPVSISGIGYDLFEALFPNPEQIIPIELDLPDPEAVEPGLTPEPTPPPEYQVGDVIPIRTGTILDHNGNPVPDGTLVNFLFTTSGEIDNQTLQVETTKDGLARTTYLVDNSGTLEVLAESENAKSEILKFDIPAPNGEIITEVPTEEATPPIPTNVPTVTATIEVLPTTSQPPQPTQSPGLADWVIAIMISSALAWSSYRLAALIGHVRWGVASHNKFSLVGCCISQCYGSHPGFAGCFPLASVVRGRGKTIRKRY